MPIDRRLRQGFERSAIVVDPDPRVTIADAVRRGKRRKRLANSARATAVIVLAALISLVGSQLLRSVHEPQPATKTPPPAPDYTEIAGTYKAKIERRTGPPASDMVGTWSLDLSSDGVLALVPPPGSAFPTSPATFQLQDRRFQTDALSAGACDGTVGTYMWALSAGHLRFTKIEDPCPVREALFAARQWQSLSSTSGGAGTGGNPVIPDDGSALAPGTYATAFQPRIGLSVTQGWTGNNDTTDWIEIRLGHSDADGALDFFQIQNVLDPETQQTIPLPQDLVGWFTSHPALDILSPPRATTIGGVQATQFDVALATGWSCGHPGCVGFAPLLPGEPGFGWSSNAAPHLRSRLFVLRVQSSTVIAAFTSARSRFEEGVRAAEAVLRTVEFG